MQQNKPHREEAKDVMPIFPPDPSRGLALPEMTDERADDGGKAENPQEATVWSTSIKKAGKARYGKDKISREETFYDKRDDERARHS
jgi:hypothetical protein